MSDITILTRKEGEKEEKSIDEQLKEEQLQDQAQRARDFFSNLQAELDEVEGDLKDGLSYLDMKNDTLLSYMIDLCNIILRKVRGETISGHASVERCINYRVILEKIKAIDQRIAYQLNKVISLPDDAREEDQGINVDNLDINIESSDGEDSSNENADDKDSQTSGTSEAVSDEGDEGTDFDGSVSASEEENEDNEQRKHRSSNDNADTHELKERLDRARILASAKEDKKKKRTLGREKKSRIYVPPKIRPVKFDDAGRESRRKDYNEFYQDEDDGEIVEETRNVRDDERTRFEEENYTRLPDDNPKKAKRKLRTKSLGGKSKKKFKGRRVR